MAQALPRYCPRCGTPTREKLRLCPTCGLPAAAMLNRPGGPGENSNPQGATPEPARIVPTPWQIQQENQPYRPAMPPMQQDFPPPNAGASPVPPANPGFSNQPASNPGAWPEQDATLAAPMQPAWDAPRNPNMQAQPWNSPARPMSPPPRVDVPPPPARGKRRLGVVLVLLVVLLALGGGGYLAFSMLGGHIPGLGIGQAPIKTINLNTPFNYAGIDITLLNAQQAQNFVDDPHSASDGMLRLNLQEQNKTTEQINWNYYDGARLLVQGKAAAAPVYVKAKGGIAPAATQTSSIDFVVPNGGTLSKISLQLGTSKEAQIQIPLTGSPDLSQYQPKTHQQNKTLTYFGLNWTLTGSTTSLNTPGQQAANGMEYLTLALKVDNTLSQQAITGSPFDYMRIKAGGKTSSPVSTTVPVSFATGETGQTGTVTFLVPQNTSSATLILLSQDPGGSGQASADFQLS